MLRVKKRILFGGMTPCTGICHAGSELNRDRTNFKISGLIDTGIATVTNVKGGTKTKTEDSMLSVSNIGFSGHYKIKGSGFKAYTSKAYSTISNE